MSKAKEIWDNLSAINVNEHTNDKNGFTYLSWTWAWATLQEEYPDSSYKFKELLWMPNGSCEVWVELTVEGITREMWLAVTDFKNKAVLNPSSDLVANTRMRCLVKAIAMFGLGHYIYAGESLPMEVYTPPFTDEQKLEFTGIMEKGTGLGLVNFIERHGRDVYTGLYNSAPKDKMKFKAKCDELYAEGSATLDEIAIECKNALDIGDAEGFREQVADLSPPLKKLLTKQFTPEHLATIKGFK